MIDKELVVHFYNRWFYGPKKADYSDFDFRKQPEELEPVVFLSTGRCGTKWLTERLEGSNKFVPIHNPRPQMRVQGRMMYQYDFKSIDENTFDLLSEIFLAGREEIFVSAKRAGKELAITDSRGTFFAYIISSLFPKAKFVFIHRNPLEVIRSGLKRGWYTLENDSELNRILPLASDPNHEKWADYSSTEKIAWLWQETNRWILEFLETIPEERKHTIRFNNWDAQKLQSLFDFMGADISSKQIEKNLKVRSNAQNSNRNPQYTGWTEENQRKALEISGDMARTLKYDL